jgi:hypothetical protein
MKSLRLSSILYKQQSPVNFCLFNFSINTTGFLQPIKGLLTVRFFKNTGGYFQVLTQEIGIIVNPLDFYFQKESGTIYTNLGYIKPLNPRDKENKYH